MTKRRGRRKRSLRPFYRKGRGRPLRSPEVVLEVFRLRNQGKSDKEIAVLFGWATQYDDYNRKVKSSTVRRYLKRAKEIASY